MELKSQSPRSGAVFPTFQLRMSKSFGVESRNPLEAGLSFRLTITEGKIVIDLPCRNPLEAGLSFRRYGGRIAVREDRGVAIPSKRGCLSDPLPEVEII